MNKDSALTASLIWESIYHMMKKYKGWEENINKFMALITQAAGYKWEHDELACEECKGECKNCLLAKADSGRSCHDDGSWWQRVIKGDRRAALEVSKFYEEVANGIHE